MGEGLGYCCVLAISIGGCGVGVSFVLAMIEGGVGMYARLCWYKV